MKKYPDIADPDFDDKIYHIYAEYKIPKKKKSFKEFCFPPKFEFQIPQKFLAEYINPKTPYRGLLVFHNIGAGKTCGAINIAEKFKHQKRIMFVVPASLKGNIRSELRSLCTGNSYITDFERRELSHLAPDSKRYTDIIKRSDSRIDKYYTLYSYNRFADLVKRQALDIRNTIMIIDEIHNMISETGVYYQLLHKLVHDADPDFRLIIMTATPIFDKPVEIALTMNLLVKDQQLPTGSEFISEFIDIETTSTSDVASFRVKNIERFRAFVKGYVSYYQGAPPYVYPKHHLHIVRVKMSDFQYKIYQRVLKAESGANQLDVDDYLNEKISNSFFIGSRSVSNIVFPNRKIAKRGFDSFHENDFRLSNFKNFSVKFVKILRRVKKSPGPVFIYSSFKKYAGIASFVALLEHNGYRNYLQHGLGPRRYAIWSGDQSLAQKDEIKAVYNNPSNRYGESIKIMLGSPAIREGVTLLRVREVHIIEPYWNFSRLNQIMGRAIRFCSHRDMPRADRNVEVYIYLAYYPGLKVSVDEYIMKLALEKENIKSVFEMALKEAAIDCRLFEAGNRGQNITCQT